MRKVALKIVRNLVLGAIGVAAVGCTQGIADPEGAAGTTSQAMLIPIAPEDMMTCALCFAGEGGGGGGGGGLSPGMEIFMGAMLEWDYVTPGSGITPVIAKSPTDTTPCPPNTDCVTVVDKPRPTLDEDRRWVTIVASETRRVSVLLPEGRPAPTRIGAAKMTSCHGDAPSAGEGQCVDWLRLCLLAVESKEDWARFLNEVWNSGDVKAKVVWGILKAGLLGNRDGRVNLCHGMFSD